MVSIPDSSVTIQTSSQSVPSTPPWLGEVTLVAQYLKHLGLLSVLEEQVRFARSRFGHYDTIDFIVVLLGYAISGERTLKAFYERVHPFATEFMALFGRSHLPHRSTLSRFLEALEPTAVEALRECFLNDVLSRRVEKEGQAGGVWDRQGTRWMVFDVDATRQAARQRALPQTEDRPAAKRRMSQVCAPGYTGRKRGEVVRTRTVVLQAHTHHSLGTFSGAGNGDYRGELGRAKSVISACMKASSLPLSQALLRLDGLYGNGAIVADLAGCPFVMRGKDYHLLDLPEIQARLQASPDAVMTHPETGTQRALFDFPGLAVTAAGDRCRVVVATHPTSSHSAPVGETRDQLVYELFFTALPVGAFTAADVVTLYLHRGAFETVLADEDQEQDSDRWCSHTACGQEFWQILSQWVWNLRLELGHALHPTPMRTTEFAPAQAAVLQAQAPAQRPQSTYGPPQVVRQSRMGCLPGSDFQPQADGTLRCPENHPLYPQERRLEHNGTLRVVYAARIGHCRGCPLREHCQGHGANTLRPRRVSAILHPLSEAPPPPTACIPQEATQPVLWGDWSRCFHRRAFSILTRHQQVHIRMAEPAVPAPPAPAEPLSRAERAQWRLSWTQRLARNALPSASAPISFTLFGVPDAFARSIGLACLA
jgi:hypothetical protein